MQSVVVLTKKLAKQADAEQASSISESRGKGRIRRTSGVRTNKQASAGKRKSNSNSIIKRKSKIVARSHARAPVECCGWGRCQVTSYVSNTHGRQPQHSQEQAQEQVSTRNIKSKDNRKSNEHDLAMKRKRQRCGRRLSSTEEQSTHSAAVSVQASKLPRVAPDTRLQPPRPSRTLDLQNVFVESLVARQRRSAR